MKITFLGTGAATSYPLAFCCCDICTQTRRLGGKDFRRRSAALVNSDLLIDLGPDIVTASFLYDTPLTGVRYWLQTHPHSDHFDASLLTTRLPDYAGVNIPPLELYASPATLVRMEQMMALEGYGDHLLNEVGQRQLKLAVHPIEPFQAFAAGPYTITAFPTDHDPSVDCLLYAIMENGFTAFYGTDTGPLPEETWQGFHEKKLRFDLVILDHTYGLGKDGTGHLNTDEFLAQVERMRGEGLLAEGARVFATHISHEGNPAHAALSAYAKAHGYEVAYDGLEVMK